MADRIPVWGDPSESPGKLREYKSGDDMLLPGGLKLQGGAVPVEPSTTPAPGSVPISRPDGSLDSRWMPDLVAGFNRSALSQAVHLTPASSGSSGIRAASSEENNFGTGDFTLNWEGSLPSWAPSSTVYLLHKHDGVCGYWLAVTSAGLLQLRLNGMNITSTEPVSVTGAAKISASIIRETASSAGSVTFLVDGVQLGDAVELPARDPNPVLGPELVKNPSFDSGADWTLSLSAAISGGNLVFPNGSTNNSFAQQTLALTTGQPYMVGVEITDYVSGSLRVGGIGGGSTDVSLVSGLSGNGTYTTVVAGNWGSGARIQAYSSPEMNVASISIRTYDPGANIDTTAPLYVLGTGTERHAGIVGGWCTYNYALTPEQMKAHHQSGVAIEDRGGSNSVISGDALNGTVTSAFDTFSGSETGFSAESSAASNRRGGGWWVDVVEGQKLRVKGVVSFSGNGSFSPTVAITRDRSTSLRRSNRVEIDSPGPIEAILIVEETGEFFLAFETRSNDTPGVMTLEVSDVEVSILGCTAQYEPESITHTQWHDSSGHGNHALLPESGASLVRPQYEGNIRWRHEWKDTQEIQYVGGVNQPIIPESAALRGYIDIIASAPVTIDIGDGADQDRYAAAVELAAGRNRWGLLTPFHDGTNRKLTIKPTANFDGTLAITAPYEILEDIA